MTSLLVETSTDNLSGTSVDTHRMTDSDWLLPDTDPALGDFGESNSQDLPISKKSQGDVTFNGAPLEITEPIKKQNRITFRGEEKLKLLQQWECLILAVDQECVTCQMNDLTNESNPEEIADVYIEDFQASDRPLLKPGAVFYWSIGRITKDTGTIERYFDLRVRRVPKLGKRERAALAKRAADLSELLQRTIER